MPSKNAKPMSNTTNTLAIQKSRIKRFGIDYLCVALFMLLIDIIVLIAALTLEDKVHANRILYIAIPIISFFCAVFLFLAIKRFLLLFAFDRARINKEYTIKIDCKSIRFIIYTKIRSLDYVIGIIFVDLSGQKYVYVLPDDLLDSKNIRATLRQKCVGKTVELICYNDTKMIKRCDVLS